MIISGLLAKTALGAAIEVGMQVGTQVLGQVKDNWDNGRELTDIKWRCVHINGIQVAASAAVSTVAPGALSSAKTMWKSSKALRALSGQAANTANRTAKLAARTAAHKQVIGDAIKAQTKWQIVKKIGKCLTKNEKQDCELS
ncbi:hypothetical protein [Pseudomonas sp. Pseu.R1]|uniref:hypothetical protein n=1 Tax=Pseudomonas sp. Pseu.R1 TaxID=3379818 RepID=UPI003B956578